MTMRTTARLFSVALLSLSLITGCASTGDTDSALAEQAIAEAKTANAAAKAANYEWRDTGKIIKQAEAKLAEGDEEGEIEAARQEQCPEACPVAAVERDADKNHSQQSQKHRHQKWDGESKPGTQ